MANTKELIDMMNVDSLTEAKQHLEKVLALVEAAPLPGREIRCHDCGAGQRSSDAEMVLLMFEPRWSNCAGCVLK